MCACSFVCVCVCVRVYVCMGLNKPYPSLLGITVLLVLLLVYLLLRVYERVSEREDTATSYTHSRQLHTCPLNAVGFVPISWYYCIT